MNFNIQQIEKKSRKTKITCGWLVAIGILASLTSITTSINLSCSFNSFSVLAMWPGYHCKIQDFNATKMLIHWWLLQRFSPETLVTIKNLCRKAAWRQFGKSRPYLYLNRTQCLGPVMQISIQPCPVSFFLQTLNHIIRYTGFIFLIPTDWWSRNYLQN